MTGKQDNKFLGFLSIEESEEKDRYIGCLLITDLNGVPQEFRCTHPVKPTSMQKPLYGKSLVPYIGIELCGVINHKQDISRGVIITSGEFTSGARDFASGKRIELYDRAYLLGLLQKYNINF